MQRTGVFVQHSVTAEDGDKEGWPVAVGEAAACGLPVVATHHGGIAHQVVHGRTGFLVGEHDWRAMGLAMSTLARDPELRATFSAAARQRAVEEFSLRTQLDKLETLLLDVVSHHPRRDLNGRLV
jgi:glycosyltransferase involved in cell wall biosynthesis